MKINRMTRKSQYYMFAAIIFITSVFVIYTSNSGIVVKKIEELQNYRDNFVYEGGNIINNAIYYGSNVSEAMRNYTGSFIDFSASNNKNLGLVYMFSNSNKIYVHNLMNIPIDAQDAGTLASDQEVLLDYQDQIWIKYNNVSYYYTFDYPDKTELKVLMVDNQ